MSDINFEFLNSAYERRKAFLETLHSENTNAYRLFHGISEGIIGLTIDRYGSLILLQTFRDPLVGDEVSVIESWLREKASYPFSLVYNHRGKLHYQSFDKWHNPKTDAFEEFECKEFGVKFFIRARHQGIDPWLFLDLRAGRRYLRRVVKGKTVLNLFSYTASVGISAAAADANEVWNVDFSKSSLEVARRNFVLNKIDNNKFKLIHEDCIPVMRQLAGLEAGGRKSQKQTYKKFEAREFDFVILDPPAWAKGKFGAIDVVNDYQSLFKAAVLATKPYGGQVLATNHVASVELDVWLSSLRRCAQKAGRPIREIILLSPEDDFPSFDGKHPLKIAVCLV